MRIMLLDNYDSFTWNLYHYLDQMVEEVEVIRNDDRRCFNLDGFHGLVISPGPGLPQESGYTPELLKVAVGQLPVLGVCLGLQAIVEHFGGGLLNLHEVLHGRQGVSKITDKGCPLFHECPEIFQTGHYHSWVADPATLPAPLRVAATDTHGTIMALYHEHLNVMAVQFHPESILTPEGFSILSNWVTFRVKPFCEMLA